MKQILSFTLNGLAVDVLVTPTETLLRLRGQAMQKAVPAGTGAMAALLGCEMDLAREICEAAGHTVMTAVEHGSVLQAVPREQLRDAALAVAPYMWLPEAADTVHSVKARRTAFAVAVL